MLADIREAFEDTSKDELPSKALVEALAAMADRPWGECNHGKPITQNWLARRLKGFGIRPGNIGPKEERAKGYQRADFEDAFSRYLPEMAFSSVHPPYANKFSDLSKNQTVHWGNECTVGNSDNTLILNDTGG